MSPKKVFVDSPRCTTYTLQKIGVCVRIVGLDFLTNDGTGFIRQVMVYSRLLASIGIRVHEESVCIAMKVRLTT